MIPDLHIPHADSRLLQTEGGNSPPDLTPARHQGLPEDLLQEAAHRLGLVCLISGGAGAVRGGDCLDPGGREELVGDQDDTGGRGGPGGLASGAAGGAASNSAGVGMLHVCDCTS